MKDLLSSVKSAHKTLITLGKLEVNKCLLNIKNEISKPIPEKRSKEYYLKRPCGNYIYHMAKIMQEYLENE